MVSLLGALFEHAALGIGDARRFVSYLEEEIARDDARAAVAAGSGTG